MPGKKKDPHASLPPEGALSALGRPGGGKKLPSFKTLPAFQFEILAGLVASRNELRHQRRFGLRSVECHILGTVGAQSPISLRKLCAELRLDKGHGSRLVTKMEDRGLLERYDDPVDKRSFYLMLTPKGMALHMRIHADAEERNREWLAGLPAAKRKVFLECLALLTEHSRAILEQEAQAAGQPAALPLEEEGPAEAGQDLMLIERAKLELLRQQLGALLEGR